LSKKEGIIPGAQAVGKAFRVLRCVAEAPEGLSAAAVAQAVTMPRTTVLRLLSALEVERLVWTDPATGSYRIGPGILELAGSYLAAQDVRRIALPFLWELAEQSEETINLAVTDCADSICIEQIESLKAVRAVSWIGQRFPVHTVATGKAWLAYQSERVIAETLARLLDADGRLPARTERTITDVEALHEDLARTRQRGYAIADGELEPALIAVAAPIYDHSGEVIATLAASGPSFRLTPERLPGLGARTAEVAGRLSAALGYSQPTVGKAFGR
jgi:DNA-binding IclR family transcriptional regulator